MDEQVIREVKPTNKKSKFVKIIGASVGIVLLITLFIIFAINTDHLTCVTFLGNDIYVTIKNDIPDLSSIEEKQLYRPGYEFVGWFKDDRFNEKYEVGTVFKGDNLYAKYERKKYTLEILDEDNFEYKSSDFEKESNYTVSNVSIKVWVPKCFCVKNPYMGNSKYEDLLSATHFDSVAKEILKHGDTTLYNTETDKSTFLIILPLKEENFKGYEVYGKDSEGKETRIQENGKNLSIPFDSEKKGCKLQKDVISDTDFVGVVLRPYFE